MYTDGTENYTEKYIQQWAKLEAVSIPELLSKYSIKKAEGKTTVPGETTPPTEPVKTTAAGDSSLADTSLGLPETKSKLDQRLELNEKEAQEFYGKAEPSWFEKVFLGFENPFKGPDGEMLKPISIEDSSRVLEGGSPIEESKNPNDVYNMLPLGGTATTTEEDIAFTYEDEKLDLLPSETYAKEGGPTTFVDKYYKDSAFNLFNYINKADFEAFLKENGYAEDFEESVKSGEFDIQSYSIMGAGAAKDAGFDRQQLLEIDKQETLQFYLNSYLEETQDKLTGKLAYEDYIKNKSDYEGIVGYDGMVDRYIQKQEESGEGLMGLYDFEAIEDYANSRFYLSYKAANKIKELQNQKIKEDREKTAGEMRFESAGDFFEKGFEAFGRGARDISYWVASGIGNKLFDTDSYIERGRKLAAQAERFDLNTNMEFAYAEGKEAEVDGTKYIVDNKGTIYDLDSETIVTNVLSSQEKVKILEASVKGENKKFISTRGGAGALGQTFGDIFFQLAAQRLGGKAAGKVLGRTSRASISKINKIRKAKGLKPINTRARNAKTGRFTSTKDTFGINIPVSKPVFEATIFQSIYGAATGYENTLKEARAAGFTDEEAESLANQAELEMMILYGLTGPINPRIKAMKNIDDLLGKNNVVRRAILASKKAGKDPTVFRKALKEGLEGIIPAIKRAPANIARKAYTFTGEGLKEVVQENIQQFGEIEIINKRLNEAAGRPFLAEDYSRRDIIETSVLSFITAGLIGSANLRTTGFRNKSKERLIDLYTFGKNIKKTKPLLDSMVEAGKISREEADRVIKDAQLVTDYGGGLPKYILNDKNIDHVELLRLLKKQQDLESNKKVLSGFQGPATQNLDKKINDVKEKINNILKPATEREVKKQADFAQKIFGKERIKVFQTKEEMLEATDADGNKLYTEDDTKKDGFFDEDGNIIINVETATSTNRIGVAAHELLHAILRAEIKTNDPKSVKLINEFRDILKKSNPDLVKEFDNRFKNKKSPYKVTFNEDGSVSGPDIDEYLTFFSEAIVEERINFEQVPKGIIETLKKYVSDIYKRVFGIDKTFETGQDVFDFIKEYSINIKEGKLTAAAKIKLKRADKADKQSEEKTEQPDKKQRASFTFEEDFDLDDDFKEKPDKKDFSAESKKAANTLARIQEQYEGTRIRLANNSNRAPEDVAPEEIMRSIINRNGGEIFSALNGMVKAKLEVTYVIGKGLQISDIEEATSDVSSRFLATKRGLPGDLYKFDGRGTLYGFLNGRLKNRIDDALRESPDWVNNFGKVDVDELKGAAQEITSVEAEVGPIPEIEKDATKTTFTPIIKSFIFTEEEIEIVSKRVAEILASKEFTSRFDAETTLNKKLTPFISELKKKTKADKTKNADLKKGAPKGVVNIVEDLINTYGGDTQGSKLEGFLSLPKVKKAFLENTTTSFLQKGSGVPQAVQKSVDGVFISFPNWVGKKIDREKTAQGNDLVRRVPNVDQYISTDVLLEALRTNPINNKKNRMDIKSTQIASEFASEMAIEIFVDALGNPDSEIYKAVITRQVELGVDANEISQVKALVQSERGNIKFSATQEAAESIGLQVGSNLFDENGRRIFGNKALAIVNTGYNEVLYNNGLRSNYNLKEEEELTLYIKGLKNDICPYLAKELVFRSGTNTTPFLNAGSFSGFSKEQFNAARQRIFDEVRDGKVPIFEDGKIVRDKNGNIQYEKETVPTKFAPAVVYENPNNLLEPISLRTKKDFEPTFRSAGKGYNINRLTADNLFYNEETIVRASKNGDLLRYNLMMEGIHKHMHQGLVTAIRNNREAAVAVSTWLAMAGNDSQHPQRYAAAISMWQEGFTREDITVEHMTPNASVGISLLNAMLDNDIVFENYYNHLSKSYQVAGIEKKFDVIVNKSYKAIQVQNYNIAESFIGARYFNLAVSRELAEGETKRGIPPETFRLPSLDENGNPKALIDVIAIDRRGRFLAEHKITQELKEKTGYRDLPHDEARANKAVEMERYDGVRRKYSESFPDANELNLQFNQMLERQSGISAKETFSQAAAQLAGAGKGRFKFFIAPGAEDFRGLVHYAFAGKGKQGEADMKFFEDNLMRPYFQGVATIDTMRQQIKARYKVAIKEYAREYKMLGQKIPNSNFTYDQALRVYMWSLQGTNIPGINENEKSKLENAILDNPELADLGIALLEVAQREEWPAPSEYWTGESVLSDLNSMTEKIGRKEILSQFIENVDAIFTRENLNKIEAIKGRKHREAIEDAIYSMKSGVNRPSGANRQLNAWLNWINGSTGAIMFFNRRSALLQLLSSTNFINWSDNNPVKAAAAFANQKQYWKDFAMIFNSDKLKERRGGLKQDVSDSEIAQVAGRSKNSPQAIIAYLLKIGFTPTQIADSLAISFGGATFYRNRVNTYLKQGMTQEEAEQEAFFDFSKKSDEAQQSSDPALVSQQQRSPLGRLVLAFANTPMQYTRLMKKAGKDLINGRGDWKENISKIAYYGFVQNLIFSGLQSALFALAFDDDDEDLDEKAIEKRDRDEKRKIGNTINSMLDTVLRGSGVYGAIASTIKNVVRTYYIQEEKGFMADHAYTIINIFNVSPPIGSKLKKVYGAIQTKKFEKDSVAARGWGLTADGKLNLGPNWAILGQLTSATLNLPLDRVVDELKSVSEALDSRNKAWQRIALALGWKTWDVGARNEEADLIKLEAQERRKKEGIEKRKETIRKNKEQKEKQEKNLTPAQKAYIERKKLGLIK